MQDKSALTILKRVGTVLVAVGILDVVRMIYCIMHGASYSSSFNIFAVIAGIFLIGGSFRTASYVHSFAIFLLSFGLTALAFALPILYPVSLALTEIRLRPGFVVSSTLDFASVFILIWIIYQLGHEAVQTEITFATGRKVNGPFSIFSGIALGVVLVAVIAFLFNGINGKKAKPIAFSQLGSGYQYAITSLNISTTSGESSVSGVVTAWNNSQIREIPVHWRTN